MRSATGRKAQRATGGWRRRRRRCRGHRRLPSGRRRSGGGGGSVRMRRMRRTPSAPRRTAGIRSRRHLVFGWGGGLVCSLFIHFLFVWQRTQKTHFRVNSYWIFLLFHWAPSFTSFYHLHQWDLLGFAAVLTVLSWWLISLIDLIVLPSLACQCLIWFILFLQNSFICFARVLLHFRLTFHVPCVSHLLFLFIATNSPTSRV